MKQSYFELLKENEIALNLSLVEESMLGKNLFIWGLEPIAFVLADYVREKYGMKVEAFVDWSGERVGGQEGKTPIVSPAELRKSKVESDCYVLIGVYAWRNVGCVLLNMGFSHLAEFAVPFCNFRSDVPFYEGEKFGNLLFVGQRTSNFATLKSGLVPYRLDGSPIRKIGAFCSVAMGATIVQNHPTYASTSSYFFNTDDRVFEEHFGACNPVTEVGNDVWLGRNAVIMPGVRIGNGAIIGSSSVVTKDVPDYAIVMGNPGQIVSFRFSPEEILLLNETQWWNWHLRKIDKNRELFQSDDVTPFFDMLREALNREECY
ncbi:CatB-related O-acetyltransferase [Pelagicoccus sp. SDUM812005]|uniref:CatB-related O-acetyltransferase n=1 Tax=Pelagicoccus sp. SDUM812005 TaxID=3041257 RepID=UPI00280DF632|nr:CatB-related O-acetyltransferase [Pelagicoccus sp. SDUM812005]MDQ8180925.1 CatB-related O-acetyltransferase [Pelagicoccus sp. SDUM812005]